MLELNNVVRAADPEAAPVLGPSRRKRSGTFHQASHRIRTRGAADRYIERGLGCEMFVLEVVLQINHLAFSLFGTVLAITQ